MSRLRTRLPFVLALAALGATDPARRTFRFDPEMVARSFRAFAGSVHVRWDEEYFYVETSGMPRHTMMVGIQASNRQVPLPQPYVGGNAFRFPLQPRFADSPVSAKESLFRGAIAIAANGVPIFNPIRQDGHTDTNLAGELDDFGGHAGRADDYHYHLGPAHLTGVLGTELPIAWALDGFPIYSYTEPGGGRLHDLDWLNGHIAQGNHYHYHATRTYPYLNGGFRGVVELRNGQVAVQPRAAAIRPSTKPLRGATITGFVRNHDSSYSLEYDLRGESYSISYALLADGGAQFAFTDGSGQIRTQTYGAKGGRSRDAVRNTGQRLRYQGPRRNTRRATSTTNPSSPDRSR